MWEGEHFQTRGRVEEDGGGVQEVRDAGIPVSSPQQQSDDKALGREGAELDPGRALSETAPVVRPPCTGRTWTDSPLALSSWVSS